MAIVIIPGNTINLDPTPEDPCFEQVRPDRESTCTIFDTSDQIKLQWRQTPCGIDLNCNPDFEGIEVFNQLVSVETGYVATGDVTFNAGGAVFAGAGSFGVSGLGLAADTLYTIRFTISNYNSGNLKINIGSNPSGACGVDEIIYTSLNNGTYSATLKSCTGGNFSDEFNFSFYSPGPPLYHDFTVSDIIIESYGNCVTAEAGWNLIEEGFIHSPGAAENLTLSSILATGDYYVVEIDISGRTQGSLTVFIGSISPANILYDNGRWYSYGYAMAGMGGNTDVVIQADTDFDGIIGYWSVKQLRTDHYLELQHLDGNYVGDVSAYISYYEDRLMINSDPSADWGIFEGCYQLALRDPCDDTVYVSASITDTFDSTTGWSGASIEDGGCTFGAGKASFTTTGDPVEVFTIQKDFNCPLTGLLGISLIRNFLAGFAASYIVKVTIDGNDYTFSGTDILVMPISAGVHTFIFQVTVSDGGIGSVVEFETLFLSFYGYDPLTYSYISSCFRIVSTLDCEKKIKGVSNTGSTSMGFLWDGIFDITHNWPINIVNPVFDIDGGTYTHSTGEKKLTSASREKVYTAVMEFADENIYDTITTQILCDDFTINGVKYVVNPKSIKPEWNANGKQRAGKVSFELTRQYPTTFYKYTG